jgi:two-component system chemotaxis response regulator CheB
MKKIRVLIADDSALMRSMLYLLLQKHPLFEVVGESVDGLAAVQAAQDLQPDIITMDLHMPRMGGIEAIRTIMASHPTRILVLCSVTQQQEKTLSIEALQAGALDFLPKPVAGGIAAVNDWAKHFLATLSQLSETPQQLRTVSRTTEPTPIQTRSQRVNILGIASSTGGPSALAKILAELPADFALPILVAQHITPGFVSGMRDWFQKISPLQIQVAQEGAVPSAGRVYLAPDGNDLFLDTKGVMHIEPSQGAYTPSADRLLQSLAASYGPRSAGIVLTGMGDDGARGLSAIAQAGGVTLIQDQDSSAVYGMPQAAAKLVSSAQILSLDVIPAELRKLSARS